MRFPHTKHIKDRDYRRYDDPVFFLFAPCEKDYKKCHRQHLNDRHIKNRRHIQPQQLDQFFSTGYPKYNQHKKHAALCIPVDPAFPVRALCIISQHKNDVGSYTYRSKHDLPQHHLCAFVDQRNNKNREQCARQRHTGRRKQHSRYSPCGTANICRDLYRERSRRDIRHDHIFIKFIFVYQMIALYGFFLNNRNQSGSAAKSDQSDLQHNSQQPFQGTILFFCKPFTHI